MKTEETERLISKYLAGTATPDEERRLSLEVNRRDVPQEWRAIGVMLGELTLGEALYEQQVQHRRSHRRRIFAACAMAASVACVSLAGWWYFDGRQASDSENIAIAHIDGHTISDESLVRAMAEDAVCDIFETADEANADELDLFDM
jgi:ferric-dicitrate binding protein FerR (iron transport regulator)